MTEEEQIRKCNICLTEKMILKRNTAAEIVCYTCNSGYVCNDCIQDFDPRGSIFCKTATQVAKAITCPCCRTPNWNYHYNQIVLMTLNYDIAYFGCEGIPPAQQLFLINQEAEDLETNEE